MAVLHSLVVAGLFPDASVVMASAHFRAPWIRLLGVLPCEAVRWHWVHASRHRGQPHCEHVLA